MALIRKNFWIDEDTEALLKETIKMFKSVPGVTEGKIIRQALRRELLEMQRTGKFVIDTDLGDIND